MKKCLFPLLLLAFSFAELQPKELTRKEWLMRERKMIGKFYEKHKIECIAAGVSTLTTLMFLGFFIKDMPGTRKEMRAYGKGRGILSANENEALIKRALIETLGTTFIVGIDIGSWPQLISRYLKFREKELAKTRSRFF